MATLGDGVVVIVGGASGIGQACAQLLHTDGAKVVIVDRQSATPGHGFAGWQTLDVRDRGATFSTIETISAEHGPPRGLIYAAGTARVTPLTEIDEQEWALVRGVNLDGAFYSLQAAALAMRPRGGAIVLISSMDAASPVDGLAHYCAAKAGVEALVRSAAIELGADGVRVNAIAPGVVRTPLMASQLADEEIETAFLERIPLGRIAESHDIAATAAFLLSDAGNWITGATIPVDGGMRLRAHPRLRPTPHKEGHNR